MRILRQATGSGQRNAKHTADNSEQGSSLTLTVTAVDKYITRHSVPRIGSGFRDTRMPCTMISLFPGGRISAGWRHGPGTHCHSHDDMVTCVFQELRGFLGSVSKVRTETIISLIVTRFNTSQSPFSFHFGNHCTVSGHLSCGEVFFFLLMLGFSIFYISIYHIFCLSSLLFVCTERTPGL